MNELHFAQMGNLIGDKTIKQAPAKAALPGSNTAGRRRWGLVGPVVVRPLKIQNHLVEVKLQ